MIVIFACLFFEYWFNVLGAAWCLVLRSHWNLIMLLDWSLVLGLVWVVFFQVLIRGFGLA